VCSPVHDRIRTDGDGGSRHLLSNGLGARVVVDMFVEREVGLSLIFVGQFVACKHHIRGAVKCTEQYRQRVSKLSSFGCDCSACVSALFFVMISLLLLLLVVVLLLAVGAIVVVVTCLV